MTDRESVEELQRAFVQELEAAESEEQRVDLLERFLREHPGHAAQLRGAHAIWKTLEAQRMSPTEDLESSAKQGELVELPKTFDDYEIISEIGRGGMGVVYLAHQVSLDRRVAIKTLQSKEAESRFFNEQRCLAQFFQSNIVPIFAAGQVSGIHYLVMPFIDGATLDKVVVAAKRKMSGESPAARDSSIGNLVDLAKSGAFKDSMGVGERSTLAIPKGRRLGAVYYRSVAECLADTANSIDQCHKFFVHRDLKPDNIIIDREGHPYILDFGLASSAQDTTFSGEATALQGDSVQTSNTKSVMGAPQYVSPEQLKCEYSPRSDVWGLGIILYELITFERAYQTVDRASPPQDPCKLNPAAPKDLAAIAMKCLELDETRRYESANEVKLDLQRWLFDQPVSARRTGLGERAWKWSRRNPALAATAAFLIVGILSTVVGFWFHNSRISDAKTAIASALTDALERERTISRYRYAQNMGSAFGLRNDGSSNVAAITLQSIVEHQGRGDLSEEATDALAGGAIDPGLFELPDYRGPEFGLLNRLIARPQIVIRPAGFAVSVLSFTAGDEELLLGCADGLVRVITLADGTLREIAASDESLISIASIADGEFATLDGNGLVCFWRPGVDAPIRTVPALVPNARQLVSNSAGDRIAVLGKGSTFAIISRDNDQLKTVHSPDLAITAIGFGTASGDLYAASGSGVVRMYSRTSAYTETRDFETQQNVKLVTVAAGADDILALGDDGKLFAWDRETADLIVEEAGAVGAKGIAFAPISGGPIAAFGNTKLTRRRQGVWERFDLSEPVMDFVLGREEELLAAITPQGYVVVYPLDANKRLCADQDEIPITEICFSPDGLSIATKSSMGLAPSVWQAATGNLTRRLGKQQVDRHPASDEALGEIRSITTQVGHSYNVNDIVYSPDGLFVGTTGGEGKAMIWDSANGQPLARLKHAKASGYWNVTSIAFDPSQTQRVATVDWENSVLIWDIGTESIVRRLDHVDLLRNGSIRKAVFTPDGRQVLATGDSESIFVWDPHTGELLATLLGHVDRVNGVVASSDGSRLASWSDDRTIRIWRKSASDEWVSERLLAGHTASINLAAFAQDDDRLVSFGNDDTIRFWDIEIGQQVAVLPGYRRGAIAPGADRLAASTADRPNEFLVIDLQKDLPQDTEITIAAGSTNPAREAVDVICRLNPDGLANLKAPDDANQRLVVLGLAVRNDQLTLSEAQYQRYRRVSEERKRQLLGSSREHFQGRQAGDFKLVNQEGTAVACDFLRDMPYGRFGNPGYTVDSAKPFDQNRSSFLLIAWQVDNEDVDTFSQFQFRDLPPIDVEQLPTFELIE